MINDELPDDDGELPGTWERADFTGGQTDVDNERVQVVRVLVYEGPRRWVRDTLNHSHVKGSVTIGPGRIIREVAFLQETPLREGGVVADCLRAMVEHSRNNPTHGYNCACKDGELRRARTWYQSLPTEERNEMRYLMQVFR